MRVLRVEYVEERNGRLFMGDGSQQKQMNHAMSDKAFFPGWREVMSILGFDITYEQEQSETTELDHCRGRRKGLLGIKLRRRFLVGHRAKQNGRRASGLYTPVAGWGLCAQTGCLDQLGTSRSGQQESTSGED